MKINFCISLILWLSCSVFADSPTPEDFAYGIPLRTGEGASICVMPVPDEVYHHIFRNDLGDIRVYNADNQPVPHTVKMDDSRKDKEIQWHALPIFPLPQTPDGRIQDIALDIQTTQDGNIISVRSITESSAVIMKGGAMLVDTGSGSPDYSELRFEWQDTDSGTIAAIAIETGDDLNHWRRIGISHTLADLQYNGHQILRNIIRLGTTPQRYLKLWFIDPDQSLTITAVSGKTEARRNLFRWLELEAFNSDTNIRVYEYQTKAFLPVVRIDIAVQLDNSVFTAAVASRQNEKSPWMQRQNGLFHNVSIIGENFTNTPLTVRNITDRFWRVSLLNSESALWSEAPRLRLGYIPHEIVFIARGRPPFTLAFGSSQVGPVETAVDDLLRTLKKQTDAEFRTTVVTGDMIVLGGASRLIAEHKLPWRQIALWVLMISGVTVVGIMAYRLYRNMDNQSK